MQEETFRSLGVSDDVSDALKARGMAAPFEIQSQVIPDAMSGQDILAKSPTGSGKTLAFAIPVVEQVAADAPTPAALILVPTRELAAQVAPRPPRSRKHAGSGSQPRTVASRSASRPRRSTARRCWSPLPDGSRICASGAASRSSGVRILVLDEADRMLDMGFQPQVDRIVRRLPAGPPDDVFLGHARR